MEERIYIDPKEMLKGFDDGINCAMCVFGTMAPKLGFNREEAPDRGAHRRRDGPLRDLRLRHRRLHGPGL